MNSLLLLAAGDTESKITPLVSNDAVVFGLLAIILGVVFYTSSLKSKFWKVFYTFLPSILLCYFLPSLLTAAHVVDPSKTQLYFVASRYLLPASLVLLTISIDLKEIFKLGPKALIMFLTGTFGVVIGGPIAVLLTGLIRPELLGAEGPEAVWRGFSTVAGSWIGGGANQAAMKEVFEPSDGLYSIMVAVDVVVAEIWMIFLLLGVGISKQLDRMLKADTTSLDNLQQKMEKFSLSKARIPTSVDFMVVLAVAFGVTAVCHFCADIIAPYLKSNISWATNLSLDSSFFWLIILATAAGIGLSFTKMRDLEGAGASKVGTVFIFILVATIGLKMEIAAVFSHPEYFLIGGVWMLIHVGLMIGMAILIRAPYFYLAVGSKANIGGAASAPVVAAAFHPSLAPVGVLLAVLGYAIGTLGAYFCALVMKAISAQMV